MELILTTPEELMETANVDLIGVVKDWAAGKVNHGLMLRGPLNIMNVLFHDMLL